MNKSTISFLQTQMCIDTSYVLEKLSSETVKGCKSELISVIETFQSLLSQPDAKDEINKKYSKMKHLHSTQDVHEVLDSFRHAFVSFSSGGLHQLFTGQENEVWYPKIVLNRELVPNDIATLPEKIRLYRGTSKNELKTKIFGQSWTTCRSIAKMFAFRHYDGQNWFEKEERVVLTTVFPKSFVYFSDQNGECEVVIDTRNLGEVRFLTEQEC